MTPALVGKLVVIGVGLIGGSFALALKRGAGVREVVGVGRTRANLETALASGIVDRGVTLDEAWTSELGDADLVLVATPVAQIPSLFAAMSGALGSRTVVTDAGSTKQDVVGAAREHLGAALPRFVPAHPIAGSEESGAAAAFATLYQDRNVILTPIEATDAAALSKVVGVWKACGAQVTMLDPHTHDRILAAVSHLPHLLAVAFVAELAVRPDTRQLFDLAGTGFRDFTRIAAAPTAIWRDIALANRDALQDEITAFRAALDVVAAALRSGDGAALEALLRTAHDARRRWAGPDPNP